MIELCLTKIQENEAIEIAHARQDESVKSGRKNKYNMHCECDSEESLNCHIIGSLGERAASIVLNCPHEDRICTFGGPDLLDKIQVRTRSDHDYDLLVRSHDKNQHAYVLVTTEDNIGFKVHGYLMGHETKKRRWWKDYGRRGHAFFVPQKYLFDIRDGIEFRHIKRF